MTGHDRVRGSTGDAHSAGQRPGTADDAARLLAEWFIELGYLQHADAVQIVNDEYGDRFVWMTEQGRWAVRSDVLDALRALLPENVSIRRLTHLE